MPAKLFLHCFASICNISIVLLLIIFCFFTTAHASRLSPGHADTAVVQTDNTVLTWGNNDYGQLGDGTNTNRLSPVHVVDVSGALITDVQEVSSGGGYMVALKTDGTLLAWGNNDYGQLGDGTKLERPYAMPVVDELDNPITHVQAIATGGNRSIALKTDGSVLFWGMVAAYPKETQLFPVAVTDSFGNPVADIQAITAGRYGHMLALRKNGTLFAWGDNSFGQLGDGTTSTSTRWNPLLVVDDNNNPITDIQAVSAGGNFVVALKLDNTLLAWGKNHYGQLGDGTIDDHYHPAPVVDDSGIPVDDIQAVSAGNFHVVALKSDNTLLAWGRNYAGQIGDGTFDDRYTPVPVVDDLDNGITSICSVAAGGHTIALKSDGTLVAWGLNSSGQLGDATKINRWTSVPVMETALMDIRSVEAGGNVTFAQNIEGNLLAWGSNSHGQLGDDTTNKRYIPGLVVTEDGDPLYGIQEVSAGSNHVLALTAAGTILAWGYNLSGQIGDGTNEARYHPVQVVDDFDIPVSDIKAVSAGGSFSLALKADGTLLSWGENDDGQLGNGSLLNQSNPISVKDGSGNTITDIQAISTGTNHSLVLKKDGTVLAWGSNAFGQLGDGTTTQRSNPAAVVDISGIPISEVQSVHAGGQFSIALKKDGTLLSWGSNLWGVLGDGSTEDRYTPVPVLAGPGNPLTGIQAVAVGSSHVLALQSDTGSMLAWGNNFYGQLGNNISGSEHGYNTVPVVVVRNSLGDPATGFQMMSVGIVHSVAVLNDSVSGNQGVAAWGENTDGQVGDWNYAADYTQPLLLITRPSWTLVSASHLYHPLNIGVYGDGTVQFTSGAESVEEDGGSILLQVNRTCGSNGIASVNYATSNGTAIAGEDYTHQSGTMEWLDGDATSRQIVIPITADSSDEGNETFTVALTNISGATPGPLEMITVTIIDKIYADTDGDDVNDTLDAFPTDPAASVDTDNDGDPDTWNPGKTEADSTTGLILDFDDDNDGMPDGWELLYGLDPIVNDAGGDKDNDGIINSDEYLQGSSPLVKYGDVNLDDEILPSDAILSLKVLTLNDAASISPGTNVDADVNKDKVIGIEDVIFILNASSQ